MIHKVLIDRLLDTVRAQFPDVSYGTFSVVHPDNEAHGDFSTNLPMVLAGALKQSPLVIAETIKQALPELKEVARVEVAPPGYINFFLSTEYLWREAVSSVTNPRYGHLAQEEQKTIVFEYGQPNTHKVPHVGHLFSYCYGESCVRLLEALGQTVKRTNYQGDVGPHVARCLWAYIKSGAQEPATLDEKVNYLQLCYQQGSAAYEDDPEARKEIDTINRQIYSQDPAIMPIWEKTRQWSLDAYRRFESRLGIRYDRCYLESEVYELGLETVRANIGTVFEEDEGAVVFRGEKYGLHTRVFITRQGTPPYEAKDLGLVQLKDRDFHFDRCIIETGNDQAGYWDVEQKAIELVFPEFEGKIEHIHHGMINLSTGKMSSRTGQILSAFSLVELVKERVLDRLESDRYDSEEERARTAEIIALGAIRFSFLKSSPGKDISFDVETSIANEGFSGPYLQYAYSRTQSILRKSDEQKTPDIAELAQYELNAEEAAVLRYVYQFPETVKSAATSYAPQILCGYLFNLAQRFSGLYSQHQIIGSGDESESVRLVLTQAVAGVLKNGLDLLGIQVSEKM